MKGVLLGHVGSINLTKVENRLQLECVLYGEGYCVNPSTNLFMATIQIDDEGKESVKAEANNNALMSMWTWMEATGSTNLSQLTGQPVVIQVGDEDELIDFQIVSKEQEAKFLELGQKQAKTEEEGTTED